MSVNLAICHYYECDKCGQTNLVVGEDPQLKDRVKCAHCGKKDTVKDITGEYRSDKSVKELESMIPSDLR